MFVTCRVFALSYLCLIALFACSPSPEKSMAHKLKVLHSSSENYWCEDNQHLHIDYYSLSDNSLSFIKFQLTANEPEITLAHSQAASGSRYSNGAIEWWHKANTGQLRVSDGSTQWRTLYNNCKAKP